MMDPGPERTESLIKVTLFSLFCVGLFLVVFSLPSVVIGVPAGIPSDRSDTMRAPSPPPSEQQGHTTFDSSEKSPPSANETTLVITTIDGKTKTPLGDVSLSIDGASIGLTNQKNGTFSTSADSDTVTIRAMKTGYKDSVVEINPRTLNHVTIALFHSDIIPVKLSGPKESMIDVVFLPSNTAYNCSTGAKIQLSEYPGDREIFEKDTIRVINNTFLKLDSLTSPSYILDQHYQNKFNFYYFWDGNTYADAFTGCAGTIPTSYWQEVPFADLTVVLYPKYYGTFSGMPCQPRGCTNSNGLGRVYHKVASDDHCLALHEIGHGLFGLMDTYCGNTYYAQNDPNPNVWRSEESCKATAQSNNWDPNICDQISGKSPELCLREFWRFDPSPEVMREGFFGGFGKASTKRIIYILDRAAT